MATSDRQLNDEEARHLSLLLDVIHSQNWNILACVILDNPGVFQALARAISRSSKLNGMTILHSCVRFDPPPSIVKVLTELVPESPTCVDCLKRTPLHVAAGTRASLPIIRFLAEAFPGACDMQDEDGKTPLHLACDDECQLFEGDQGTVREPSSYEVVATLVNASPLSVPLEDTNGMSALEHAIFSDASIAVVKLLQSATRKQCQAQERASLSTGKDTPSQAKLSIGMPETSKHKSCPAILVPGTKEELSSMESDF